ncbi:hypothetical protein MBLNU459_g3421t1 [Dothideomycetes sp. NU459]
MTTLDSVVTASQGLQDPNPAVPRKRRRRTAATGAADDCFACRSRQTKCDRKRPYCGQCLEIGKDCSGYKTTLTWGVGVASRGKLRGLSCPVANKAVGDAVESKKTVTAHKRKSSVLKDADETHDRIVQSAYCNSRSLGSGATNPLPPPQIKSSDHIKIEADVDHYGHTSMPIPIPRSSNDWQYPQHYGHFNEHSGMQKMLSLSTNRSSTSSGPAALHISLGQGVSDSSFPLSASSMSTFSDADYGTPAEYPQTPGTMSYADSYPPFFNNPFPDQQLLGDSQQHSDLHGGPSFVHGDNTLDTSVGDSEHLPQQTYPQSMFDQEHAEYQSQVQEEFDEYSNFDMGLTKLDSQQALDQPDMSLTLPRTIFTSQFIHLSSRMQYLLDYYDKHICSVLVAFDGPVNPYRLHILQLATQNEGLQNALAALALNNMRMRNEKWIQPSGYIEELSESGSVLNVSSSAQSKPTPEESCYKTLSIGQLQMQLASIQSAQDDSVLATLLILCLFHVCDSGFSKFKTQLEGVQKLLSMRDPGVRTGFIGWVEMFFTWFDVMTSTVNDRETEIQGDRLDMLHYSSNLGALEQFSGCDGRLFKLIARLGRLNLLSQNRPVRTTDNRDRTPRPSLPPSKPSQTRYGGHSRWSKRRMIDPMDYTKLDGNGWGAPIITSSDEEDPGNLPDEQTPAPDSRHEFWVEWHDIRSRLQSWSMDPSSVSSPQTPIESSAGHEQFQLEQRDLVHINESFRSSALLYTERLAHPLLPSSSPNFQNLVRSALAQITALPVTSCVNKFLLWPLFIAGTECVDLKDRALVRDRCVEIQRESGFFNNLSVLEVLERVWKETGHGMAGGDMEEIRLRRRDSSSPSGRYGQAFRWRRAMDRVDGEYIIV